MTEQHEKFGGRPVSRTRIKRYLDCMMDCNLMDLGFVGSKFIWFRNRVTDGLMMERLDRAWCNTAPQTLFPEALVTHLPRPHSDHCPLLLDSNPVSNLVPKAFKFESIWVSHPDFLNLVHNSWSVHHIDIVSNALFLLISYFNGTKIFLGTFFINLKECWLG